LNYQVIMTFRLGSLFLLLISYVFKKNIQMKRSLLVRFCFASFAIALVPCGVSCNARNANGKTASLKDARLDTIEAADQTGIGRESITFILGEDKGTKNPYYAQATKYYKYNGAGKTDYLVTTCRSLLEVRNYLISEKPSNKLPWGIINMVSHGDQWLGLSVKVTPQSKRSTLERLQEYLNKGTFKPMPDNIIDHQSELILHACGVGNCPEFVAAIGKVFRNSHDVPLVRAPLLFEFYSSISGDSIVEESQKYFANAWITYYKKDQRPGDSILCSTLNKKYPNSKVAWSDALNRTNPRWSGDIYHYAFNVPVNCVIKLAEKDTLPAFSSNEQQLSWINKQPAIVKALKSIEITVENFDWSLSTVYTKNKNGKRSAAILAKGVCTILCILKPLTTESENTAVLRNPFVPGLDDNNYYFTAGFKNQNLMQRR